MIKFIAIWVLLLAVPGTSLAQQTPPIDVSGLSETSMSFDQEGVAPFLIELSRSFASGLDSSQADALAGSISLLPVEETGYWEYAVVTNGRTDRLVVVAFKDDIDAPDLAFYSAPELAARISKQLESFAQTQGW